jgi:hypothetical protein
MCSARTNNSLHTAVTAAFSTAAAAEAATAAVTAAAVVTIFVQYSNNVLLP